MDFQPKKIAEFNTRSHAEAFCTLCMHLYTHLPLIKEVEIYDNKKVYEIYTPNGIRYSRIGPIKKAFEAGLKASL
jgi:hypothetical protein